jgi:DNA-binding MarR family transcriptional regulator
LDGEIRERLRREFNATLPRFDVMAALYRAPEGMLMSEVSRFLMVSNGNVTGIVGRLVGDGLVLRAQRRDDRRTSIVRLTAKGRDRFEEMAAAHESWIDELLGGMTTEEAHELSTRLSLFQSDWEGAA